MLKPHHRDHAHPSHEAAPPEVAHPHAAEGLVWDATHEHSVESPQGLIRGAIALGIGLYLTYLVVTGDVGNYINIRFSWIAVVGAALALLLGGHALVGHLPIRGIAPGEGHDHLDHEHQQPRWPALAMLALPLAMAVLIPAQPLGAAAVGGSVSFVSATGPRESATIASADSLDWSVLDWLRAYSFGSSAERLNGKPADVTGFIFRNEGDPSGYIIVARFLMVHCTADSYAIGMPARWAGADTLPADTWVRVQGTVRVGKFGDDTLPIIEATSVEQIPKPGQVYLYK